MRSINGKIAKQNKSRAIDDCRLIWHIHNKSLRSYPRAAEYPLFPELAKSLCENLAHALLVDQVKSSTIDEESLMKLLEEHINHNIVKIGQHLYRQNEGIPQGSTLSTLLCRYETDLVARNSEHLTIASSLVSFVYAELDKNELRYTQDRHSVGLHSSFTLEKSSEACQQLLMRMVDDFLLITADESVARRFLRDSNDGTFERCLLPSLSDRN